MITPRRTRLFRVPDLPGFQRILASLIAGERIDWVRDCAILVPTRTAGRQLRRTLERRLLEDSERRAMALPEIVTRDEWYEQMHGRLGGAPPRLTELEREVLFRAAAEQAISQGHVPPFRLRPGLVAEILAFYEALGRLSRTVDAFERLMVEDLEASASIDRGADRLLRQTRFLVAAFRAYAARVRDSGSADERRLREFLLDRPSVRPLRHVIVAVPDRAASVHGLWPADFTLLARMAGLERLDIVATEGLLAAGLLERLHEALPELEEQRVDGPAPPPVLRTPPAPAIERFFVTRDRETELAQIVRTIKREAKPGGAGGARTVSDRLAVVFQRPLPYLYVAGRLFDEAHVPFETVDALPLAAEPYAAALDLVMRFIDSDASREATVALLFSPHFTFEVDERAISLPEVEALDAALQMARHVGGSRRLATLAEHWSAAPMSGELRAPRQRAAAIAAKAAAAAALELEELNGPARPSQQIETLVSFLRQHERLPDAAAAAGERHLRARAAVLGALESLRLAHARFDDAERPFAEVGSAIRRWIESQTFAPRRGHGGVQLVDAEAARYGDFDDLWIVGLVDGEWPPRPPRNIFYPSFLLSHLGWPSEVALTQAARASFIDLVSLARRSVALSSFTLEDDAVVSPTALLEDVEQIAPATRPMDPSTPARVFVEDALTSDPVLSAAVTGAAAAWLDVRRGRSPAMLPQFRGRAGPPPPRVPTVTSIELYLDCPFKYFGRHVLRLEEERADDVALSPRDRGRFLHDIFREFFDAWHSSGRGAITPANVADARQEFARLVDRHLTELPEADRSVERSRLLGSATQTGVAEQAFEVEAARDLAVVDRLLEVSLTGEWEIGVDPDARTVALRATADRVDVLADGTFRLFDYKTGKVRARRRAIQLPVYGACVTQLLGRTRSGRWHLREAGYLAFGESPPYVPLARDAAKLGDALIEGQRRFLRALDDVSAGRFPVKPAEVSLCEACGYASVCRKDYVEAEPSENGA